MLKHITSFVKHGGGDVMVCPHVAASGTGSLVFIDWTVKALKLKHECNRLNTSAIQSHWDYLIQNPLCWWGKITTKKVRRWWAGPERDFSLFPGKLVKGLPVRVKNTTDWHDTWRGSKYTTHADLWITVNAVMSCQTLTHPLKEWCAFCMWLWLKQICPLTNMKD